MAFNDFVMTLLAAQSAGPSTALAAPGVQTRYGNDEGSLMGLANRPVMTPAPIQPPASPGLGYGGINGTMNLGPATYDINPSYFAAPAPSPGLGSGIPNSGIARGEGLSEYYRPGYSGYQADPLLWMLTSILQHRFGYGGMTRHPGTFHY